MYVKVMYMREGVGYAGRAYTYRTCLPLKPFEKVIVDAAGERKKALVVETNVPEETLDTAWKCKIKEVIGYDEEGEI